MLLEDTVESIIVAERNCRICLKLHSDLVSVQIHTSYYWIFETLECLAADDRRQNRHLHLAESLSLGLGYALLCPECIIFLLESVEDILYGCCPVHFVCIRKDQGEDILGGESILCKEFLVIQRICHSCGIHHHL
jgi:hypothetical protein